MKLEINCLLEVSRHGAANKQRRTRHCLDAVMGPMREERVLVRVGGGVLSAQEPWNNHSPSDTFKPRRLPAVLRPFLDEPPAFFDACRTGAPACGSQPRSPPASPYCPVDKSVVAPAAPAAQETRGHAAVATARIRPNIALAPPVVSV